MTGLWILASFIVDFIKLKAHRLVKVVDYKKIQLWNKLFSMNGNVFKLKSPIYKKQKGKNEFGASNANSW